MEDAIVFGDKIRLTRTISTEMGARSLTIHDRVENFGGAVSPFTILYHINAGFPLLDAGAELVLSRYRTRPADARSRRGLKNHRSFSAPVTGFKEECYYHTMAGDRNGRAPRPGSVPPF